MKSKFALLFCLLFFYTGILFSQEKRLKYIGIEAGTTFHMNEMSNMEYIRGDIPSYGNGYSTSSITSLCQELFFGLKAEILSMNDRFGLSAGIRYSRINSSVGKPDYWTGNSYYFYWLYRQDGVNTDYLRVREIKQTSDYLGIPLEIRYYTAPRPRPVRFFIKAGTEINFLVHSKKDVEFKDEAMDNYKSDIELKTNDPDPFYATVYFGGGFRIGKELKPSLSLEGCLGSLFLGSGSFGLVDPEYGGGFQINIQIPLISKVK
jgi:hypothetical protein